MDGARALDAQPRPQLATGLERRFGRFAAANLERARRLAWRLVGGDEAAAEDVVQEALVRAYRGLARFRDEASLETWFYRILVRQAHNYRRWRRLRTLWTAALEAEPADPAARDPGDPALRRRIRLALDALSRGQREAFVLVHLEGWSVRESAALLGKSEGTVKSHLHRALRSLRSALGDLAPDTGGTRA